MTEQNNQNTTTPTYLIQDTWSGAVREFFRQLGSVTVWLLFLLFIGQGCGFIDIYRLLDK